MYTAFLQGLLEEQVDVAAKLEPVSQLGRQFFPLGKSPIVFQKARIANSSRTLGHQDYRALSPHGSKNIGDHSDRMVEVCSQQTTRRHDDDVQLPFNLWTVDLVVAGDSFPEH